MSMPLIGPMPSRRSNLSRRFAGLKQICSCSSNGSSGSNIGAAESPVIIMMTTKMAMIMNLTMRMKTLNVCLEFGSAY